MTQKSEYSPLSGGLDEESAGISVPPGRVIAVLNHEAVSKGYQRTEGYERFDGQPQPHKGADAAAIAARRALITAVPGSGSVRGVKWFDGKLFAWRDNAGASSCVVHESSAAGWVATDLGKSLKYNSGGLTEISATDVITGATSGATATVRKVFLDEETYWDQQNAAGTLVLDNVVGVFQNDESLNVGAENDVATVDGTIFTFVQPPGGRYEFVEHNFYGSVGTAAIYGVNGVGKGFEFDGTSAIKISTGMPDDKPFLVAEHKNHLFFGFRLGSVQNSSLGEPRSWCPQTGASEIGMGKELTNFISNATTSLVVTTSKSFAVLSGNDSTDFRLDTLSDEAGARAQTAQRIGNIFYMDERGVRSAANTQTTANFKLGTYTQMIQETLKTKRKAGVQPVASMTVKTKDQYVLFFDDGTGINIYMGRKNPEPMKFTLPFIVSCIDVAEVNGEERIFAGATNGFVYELNVGTSFDGANITSFIQLPFGHEGGPLTLKRYHGAVIEHEGAISDEISVTAWFDYAVGMQSYAEVDGFTKETVDPQGFVWIQGSGKNMSLVIGSDSAIVSSYILQGVHRKFSPRGVMR